MVDPCCAWLALGLLGCSSSPSSTRSAPVAIDGAAAEPPLGRTAPIAGGVHVTQVDAVPCFVELVQAEL